MPRRFAAARPSLIGASPLIESTERGFADRHTQAIAFSEVLVTAAGERLDARRQSEISIALLNSSSCLQEAACVQRMWREPPK